MSNVSPRVLAGDLRTLPSLRVLTHGRLACLRVDVLARHDGRGRLVYPPLRVDLAGEVPGVFLAGVVPVACPPLAVLAPLDAGL